MTQASSLKDSHLKSPLISFCLKGMGGLFFILLLYLLITGCNRPHATGIEFDEIDTSQEPLQTTVPPQEPIVVEWKKAELKITPVAVYKIAALVVGTESYSYGWNATISPVDLALAWGKLADPESRRYVSYSVSNRWVSFKMKEGCPFDTAYVISHASNNHIIPSNRNIWYALKTIREKKKVVLEGFLVNVSGTYDGKTVWWNTSLSRTDSGNGSCELLYVTKARIENKVYE
jgi:hypothetical protein